MSGADPALLDRLIPAGPRDRPSLGATNWLLSHGLPEPRDEAWRYTPVDEVLDRLATATPARPRSITPADVDRLAGVHGPHRLVLVNGVPMPTLSDVDAPPVGVWLGRRSDLSPEREPAPAPDLDPVEHGFTDGFQALNRAGGGDPATVIVDAPRHHGTDGPASAPLHVVHVAVPGTEPQFSQPRTVIEVGARSHLHLIETFTGFPGAAVTNAATTIRLGRDATVTQHRVQAEASGATHIGHTQVSLAGGSSYQASSIMLGADIARHAIDVTLHEPDARVALTGLYRPAGRQRHDTAVCIDHAASSGTSTQDFRGIVDDHARGSFSGRIIVRPGTAANDAQQMNRNLLLQRSAEADTRPWLEIFADEVRCTHGATVGRLDDDALFYLRSRGIPFDEGRTMLIDAFAREITDAIDPPSLRDHIAALVDPGTPAGQP